MATPRQAERSLRRSRLASEFGKRLEAMRTAKGLSQQQLANKAGFAQPMVARFERGTRLPDLDHIVLLACALELSPGKLLPPGLSAIAQATQTVEPVHRLPLNHGGE